MTNYGWIIDRDLLYEEDPEMFQNAVGVTGPSDIPDDIQASLSDGDGRKFQMFDDDREMYFTGRYIGPDDDDMLGPLDDFGTPDSGCTEIRYYNEDTKEWETL